MGGCADGRECADRWKEVRVYKWVGCMSNGKVLFADEREWSKNMAWMQGQLILTLLMVLAAGHFLQTM